MKIIRSALCIVTLAAAYAFFVVGFVFDRVADALNDYHEEPFR